MLKFVIDREIAGVGNLGGAELHGIAVKSCPVLRELPQVQWLHSYVTDDKIYCIYYAPDESLIREHARRGGFRADRISAVRQLLDPVNFQ